MKTVKKLPGIIQIAFMLVLMLSLVACAPKQGFIFEPDKSLSVLLEKAPAYPEAGIVVMSDLHIYDTSLGTTGEAFEAYITADRKLVREGPEILDAAIASIKTLAADIVLVPGDITKDGEISSHELAASYLAQLKAAGKKVYVVPGNHDVMNGHSYKYVGSKVERVPNVTADQFAQIYADFGYKDAVQRDPASLSYVVEIQPGLWLLGLDSCRYNENIEDTASVTDGKFSPQTLGWIEKMLGQAAKDNKAVITMMHHGVMEHYIGQEKNYGEYIVDDAPEVSRLLAAYNARLVLTGHYHAQDITVKKWDNTNKFVFDIETGSLVTYPCPYRVVNINADQQAVLKTEFVTAIKSHPQDFPAFGKQYLLEGIAGIGTATLTGTYKVDRTEAEKISKEIAVAFAAHYAGDEKLAAGQQPVTESGLSPLGWVVIQMRKDLLIGLWNDLPPADNNITLNLKDGTWK